MRGAPDSLTLPWVLEEPLKETTSVLVGCLPLRREQVILYWRQGSKLMTVLLRAGKVGNAGLPDYAALCATLCSGVRLACLNFIAAHWHG